MILKADDVIQVRESANSHALADLFVETAEARGIVPWLTLDRKQYKGEVQHVPTREEIGSPINEQLIVELYSK